MCGRNLIFNFGSAGLFLICVEIFHATKGILRLRRLFLILLQILLFRIIYKTCF